MPGNLVSDLWWLSGIEAGFSVSFFRFPLLIVIPPLLDTDV
jgi:hypothetical protein